MPPAAGLHFDGVRKLLAVLQRLVDLGNTVVVRRRAGRPQPSPCQGASMSRYPIAPVEFTALHTVPLASRGGKVKVADFATPYQAGAGVAGLLRSMPRILAGDSLRGVVAAILAARAAGKPVVWGLGGHVVKCGLAPVLIDLMERGCAAAFAMNGAAAIHDFEIALARRGTPSPFSLACH